MAGLPAVPPGRAGRIWLRVRIASALRASELLDRKLRALQADQRQAKGRRQDTDAEWQRRCREARTWSRRVMIISGERELVAAAGAGSAHVAIRWYDRLGARCPSVETCDPAPPNFAERGPGTAALIEAAAAYAEAVRAAVEHAAAVRTCDALDREVLRVRRLLRALSLRRLPALRQALREREEQLAESERAQLIRLRCATVRMAPGTPATRD